MHEQVPDAANAEVGDFGKGEFKERPRRYDMERLDFLVEVAQRGYCPWTDLYFVEEQERLAGRYAMLRVSLYVGNDARYQEVAFEDRDYLLVGLEIDFDEIAVETLGKMANRRGLANLARAAEEKRLVVRIFHPFDKNFV